MHNLKRQKKKKQLKISQGEDISSQVVAFARMVTNYFYQSNKTEGEKTWHQEVNSRPASPANCKVGPP